MSQNIHLMIAVIPFPDSVKNTRLRKMTANGCWVILSRVISPTKFTVIVSWRICEKRLKK